MLNEKELDMIIHKSLQKILDEVNNHVDRDNYKIVETTLSQAYDLIKTAIKQKGE